MKNLICIILMGCFIVLSTTQCSETKVPKEAAPVTPTTTQAPKPAQKAAPKKMENSGQKMPWVSLGDVEGLVKKEPRKILVDVYTPWCGPCKMMDRNTFSNPEIISTMGDKFYPIKFNAEGPDPITYLGKEYTNPQFNPNKTRGRNAKHQLASLFPVRGYPSLIVMNEQFKIIGTIVGYRTPEQLKGDLAQYMN